MTSKLLLKTINVENIPQVGKKECGLHSTIRWTLFCSRSMGLLPLDGLLTPTSHNLRFTLRSPYTVFYAISLIGQVLMFIANICWLMHNGMSLLTITNSLFYTSSLLSFLILVYIGRSWPIVIMKVENIECKLPPFTRNVAARSNITMILTLTAALVEHILSVYYGLTVAHACSPNNVAENYFRFNMPWIFDYTPFTLWKGILSELVNLQSTFIWSYNDLLVMVLSIYLTEHFLVHNELLKKAAQQKRAIHAIYDMGPRESLKEFFEEFFACIEFREQYLKIVRLVKIINGQFGIYILISFGSNLYWICTQLFYSLTQTQTGHFIACKFHDPEGRKAINGVEHSIYFTYSFSFLLLRTLLVLLLAARIHSNSVAPLHILYGVPSSRFSIEVERFIAQISNIKVAMSGLDFFYVTRTMILTLLGTIVTYELVLLQYNR